MTSENGQFDSEIFGQIKKESSLCMLSFIFMFITVLRKNIQVGDESFQQVISSPLVADCGAHLLVSVAENNSGIVSHI